MVAAALGLTLGDIDAVGYAVGAVDVLGDIDALGYALGDNVVGDAVELEAIEGLALGKEEGELEGI